MLRNTNKGFTLIELIIVMVILGIMAAVAVPRYLDSIANAEESAEDAVISAIRSGLKQYANNSLVDNGRATWPTNPFDALSEKPAGFTNDDNLADIDGEWTFVDDNPNMIGNTGTGDGIGKISHQRGDNTRYTWEYRAGTQTGDNAEIGSIGPRIQVLTEE